MFIGISHMFLKADMKIFFVFYVCDVFWYNLAQFATHYFQILQTKSSSHNTTNIEISMFSISGIMAM